jgi:uncharacterized peroxidase-related enzyme
MENYTPPHINLNNDLHGIRALLAFRPAIAPPLTALMEVMMRSDDGLVKGERELIAAFVSALNNCDNCSKIHSEIAQCFFVDNDNLVKQVLQDYTNAPISQRLKVILSIAKSVQKNGKSVTSQQIQEAKNLNISDLEIHDTVLIAAMFCFFNRYNDGLGLVSMDTPETYKIRGKQMAAMGYSMT